MSSHGNDPRHPETGDIVIAGARYSQGYKESHPHLWRVKVE